MVKEVIIMKKNTKIKHLMKITLCAMLIALSIVIGIVCKDLFTFGVYYRITFENLPIIFAAITLGPIYGAAAGLCGDVISCLLSTNPNINPIITLGAISVGLFSGIVAKLIRKEGLLRIIAAAACGHLIGQVIIKSIGKIIVFGMPAIGILIGLGLSAAICIVEVTAIDLLLKNKAVNKYLEKLK